MGDIREPTPDLDRGVTNPTTSIVNEAATNRPVNFPGNPPQATATVSSTTSSSTAQPTGKNMAIQWDFDWNMARSFPVLVAGDTGAVPHTINALLMSDLVMEKGEWSYKQANGTEVILVTTSTQSNQVPNSGDTGETRVRQTNDRSLEKLSGVPYGSEMRLTLTWLYNGETGWSRSGIFTVVEPAGEPEKREELERIGFETEEVLPDEVSRILNGGSNVIPLDPSNTDLTSAPSTTGIASSTDDDADSDHANDGGGLSIGAKAGIGAGAGVVGLALIIALLWFFCLRNRHKKKGHVSKNPYNTEGHVSEYMVNKETTGARVTESPHSPYSDDGSLAQQQQQQIQNQTASSSPRETTAFVTSAAAAPSSSRHNLERQSEGRDRGLSEATPLAASTPRSDSQQQQHESARPEARSATPQGVNSNVSHLIEDGMTEDEIRRLEDEERQLDAAIEQHGHGRRLA
ncbi:hypothetical protein D7B24_000049 [Verticillium nonalfalfae]|uniref:Mid2 domain-containing protein n=1 Tax=Verticillium nonalfalfae TaxID=1051616 RepID=A0A3M9YN59_9PEZI|nr:uncharacterized protein D7B24_000049 [Verticillium nonalfalfae]RNJ61196.1 hypothetical protein D7B24_000049 [Verticillium nonalfalfae]